jgi:hypothetical protein
MARKALLRGNAGHYQIRGTIWELGSFAYRAYVHLIPTLARPTLSQCVVSADGMSLKEVIGATKARVTSRIGATVNALELLPKPSPMPLPDVDHSALRRRVPRRFPPPTD